MRASDTSRAGNGSRFKNNKDDNECSNTSGRRRVVFMGENIERRSSSRERLSLGIYSRIGAALSIEHLPHVLDKSTE